jgi:hypothetical protein
LPLWINTLEQQQTRVEVELSKVFLKDKAAANKTCNPEILSLVGFVNYPVHSFDMNEWMNGNLVDEPKI